MKMEVEGAESSEKQRIEMATVMYYLNYLNRLRGSDYSVQHHGDAPDFRIANSAGDRMDVEVTLSDDRDGDIAVLLGRKECRTPGPVLGGAQVDCSTGVPLGRLVEIVKAKSIKRYGDRCALVIRQASPVGWDLEHLAAGAREVLKNTRQPYTEGVWLISLYGDECVRLL